MSELDAQVAEKVMGESGSMLAWTPAYSKDIEAAWLVVEAVQKKHPGWRFCLLGGDTTNQYQLQGGTRCGGFFGWKAEFFGHEDADKDYGQRHGQAYAPTAPEAICRAALAAMEAK